MEKRKSQGDSTQYPAETLLSSLTSLWKKSEDRRGICRTSCVTSLPPRRRGTCKLFEAHGLTAYGLFPHKSLQEQAPVRVLHEKSPALCAELRIVCGEGGIRTPGASQLNSFQDCRNRPLYHLSIPNWDCKFRKLFQICKIFL